MESQQPDASEVPRDVSTTSRTLTQDDLEEYGIQVNCPPDAIPAILAAAASVEDIPEENAALARSIANAQEDSDEVLDEDKLWGRNKKVVLAGAGVGAVVIVSILGAVVFRIIRGSRGGKNGPSRSMQTASGARGSRGGSVRSGGSQGVRGTKSQGKKSTKSTLDAGASGAEKPASRRARSAAGGASTSASKTKAPKASRDVSATRAVQPTSSRPAQSRVQGSSATPSGLAAGSSKPAPADSEAAAGSGAASSHTQPSPSSAAKASPEALPKPKPRRTAPSLSGNVARGIKKDAAAPSSASTGANNSKQPNRPGGGASTAEAKPLNDGKANATAPPEASVTTATADTPSDSAVAAGNQIKEATAPHQTSGEGAVDAEASVAPVDGTDNATSRDADKAKPAQNFKGMLSGLSFNAEAQEFRPRDEGSPSMSPIPFNVNAPEFKPTRSASETQSSLGRDASISSAGRLAEQGAADNTNGQDMAASESQPVVADSTEEAAAASANDAEIVPLEPVEYDMGTLHLTGANIAEDAEETEDEKYAKKHLVEAAERIRALGTARASKADLLETGTEKLQADIEYCKTHEVRPFIFAEHASTAADFLFHIGDFEAAEKMLADAVQAAKMAGNDKLYATLINNLGSALVKQGKDGEALYVHQNRLNEISADSITSNSAVIARHSVVDILSSHKQYAQCVKVLEEQCKKLYSHYMHTLADHKQASTVTGDNTAEITGAKQRGSAGNDSAGNIATALQALARCHLDHGKHYTMLKDHKKAVEQGRKALGYYQEAQKYRVDVNPVYLSFMASQVKSLAQAAKQAGDEEYVKLFKESRQLYRELIEAAEAAGRKLEMDQMHHTIASLSAEIGDTETAGKEMDLLLSHFQSKYKCKALDPQMQAPWEAKAEVMRRCGDMETAQHCHRQALKCKSPLRR